MRTGLWAQCSQSVCVDTASPRHACLNRRGGLFKERVKRRGPLLVQNKYVTDLRWARSRHLGKQGYPRDTVQATHGLCSVQAAATLVRAGARHAADRQEPAHGLRSEKPPRTGPRRRHAWPKGKGRKSRKGATKGKAKAGYYSGPSAAASSAAAEGKGRRKRGVGDYKRMTVESALFSRYGGKTWARILLACNRIDPVHIQAMSEEIKMRIRDGEHRKARVDFRRGREIPVNAEATQRRKLPRFDLNENTDWRGGATHPGTNSPGTLVHVAIKAFAEHYNMGAWW